MGDRVALLLPGMTLNASIFPGLGMPATGPDFNRLLVGADGSCSELLLSRMGFYANLLDEDLRASAAWGAPRRLVVAHSFGAMLAMWWLTRSLDDEVARVDGLILVSTTAGPMFERLSIRLGQLGQHELRVPAGSLVPLWNHPDVTRTVKWLLCGGLHTETVDFRAERIRTDLELDLAGWRNTDWRAMRSFRLAVEGFDVRDRLCDIAVPTIVLHGTHDSLFGVDSAHELASGIPGSELRLVDGAGHALPITHGEEIVKAAKDLLPA